MLQAVILRPSLPPSYGGGGKRACRGASVGAKAHDCAACRPTCRRSGLEAVTWSFMEREDFVPGLPPGYMHIGGNGFFVPSETCDFDLSRRRALVQGDAQPLAGLVRAVVNHTLLQRRGGAAGTGSGSLAHIETHDTQSASKVTSLKAVTQLRRLLRMHSSRAMPRVLAPWTQVVVTNPSGNPFVYIPAHSMISMVKEVYTCLANTDDMPQP